MTDVMPLPGAEWSRLPPDLQAVTPILRCRNCGSVNEGLNGTPNDIGPSDHCGDCPPWTCEDCGQPCSREKLCPCWVKVDGLPLADIKGLLAQADLSVGIPDSRL